MIALISRSCVWSNRYLQTFWIKNFCLSYRRSPCRRWLLYPLQKKNRFVLSFLSLRSNSCVFPRRLENRKSSMSSKEYPAFPRPASFLLFSWHVDASPPPPFFLVLAAPVAYENSWARGLNPHHSSDASHCSNNTRCLTQCAKRELLKALESHLQHMEVHRLGLESELQLLAYATAVAMPDPSLVCNLNYSSQQCRILNPRVRPGLNQSPHGY